MGHFRVTSQKIFHIKMSLICMQTNLSGEPFSHECFRMQTRLDAGTRPIRNDVQRINIEMYFILQIFILKPFNLFLEITLNPCQHFCEATNDGKSIDVIQMDLENGSRCYDNFSSFDVCIQGKCQVCYMKQVKKVLLRHSYNCFATALCYKPM